METIKVKMWGGYKFHYDPVEVQRAQTDGEVLECLKDWRGVPPYSSIRCANLAETPDGQKLVKELRRLCEGRTDQGKGKKKGRKSAIHQD